MSDDFDDDGKKNPSSRVFWNDLENDEHLKTCSLGAKGLWTCHLLPMAARSPEPGVILVGDFPSIVAKDLPRRLSTMVGASPEEVAELLLELVQSRAASIDDKGRIYNRRMVREEAIRQARSAAGKAGAAGRWQKKGTKCEVDGKHHGKRHGKTETGDQPVSRGEQREMPGLAPDGACEPDGKSMPSSILHDSKTPDKGEIPSCIDRGVQGGDAAGQAADTAPRAKRADEPRDKRGTRIPKDWRPDDELRQWTIDTIRDAGSQISAGHVLEEFRDYWCAVPGAKGLKLDWRATWRNRIRELIKREGTRNGAVRQVPTNTSRPLGHGTRQAAAYAAFRSPRDRESGGSRDAGTEPELVGSASLAPGTDDRG